MYNARWVINSGDDELAERLASQLGVSKTLGRLVSLRGCSDGESAWRFLNPKFDHLHNPWSMKGMRQAVDRILRAVNEQEKILIYGDYDVDGTTGTVVLRRALKLLGARTGYHVPHRFTEGYGINQEALELALASGYRLVLSVDCGIRAHEPLFWARDNGLDVIVTDHHLPDADHGSPPAFAVLNPNQDGCDYPDKNLAGVGVAFKLVQALLRENGREHLESGFLKMVAIGTVADVAPLVGENRTIVALGLADLPSATNPGLRALMEVSGCANGQSVSSTDLGFRLGPRINAAGRMDAARAVVELFEAETHAEAHRLAVHLDSRNRERQNVQRQIVELAIAEVEKDITSQKRDYVAVIAGEGWHRGVIGIAASKIAERIHRPCVVISFEDELGHGSGRSIEAYHLLDGLSSCAELFEKFGGHSHAAGLTIRRENLGALREALNTHAMSCLTVNDLTRTIRADMELDLESVGMDLLNELARLEPFGAGNPRPMFISRNVRVAGQPLIMKEKHLKVRVACNGGQAHEAVWWSGVEELSEQTLTVGAGIEMAYTIEPNFWQGIKKLQLSVKDIQFHN
jgi:single-stranded-DNA-specific exonuclease